MAIERSFNIAGKDWLTVPEAAHYCGVSESQFRHKAADLGLIPSKFMGKQLYEKAALYRAIDASQSWSDMPAQPMRSLSSQYPNLVARPLRPYKPRKKKS